MKKIRNLEKNEGVTLIALVITIIVLLILAGVSISTLMGPNGIITKAKQAKEQTVDAAVLEEITMEVAGSFNGDGDYDVDNAKMNLEDNLGATVNKVNNSLNVEYEGKKIKVRPDGTVRMAEKVERTGIKIGDYIDYKPTLVTEKSDKNMEQDQDMKWRVLKIHEDGTIDLIGNQTSGKAYFGKAEGYNNGVTIMNKICRDLYSNKAHGIYARSINQEDIENAYKPGSAAETAKNNIKNAKVYTYSGKKSTGETYENRYYPAIYEQEIGSNIDSVEKGKLGPSDQIEIITGEETTVQRKQKQGEDILKVKPNWYNVNMVANNFIDGAYDVLKTNDYYWVASRCVSCGTDYAYFGLRLVNSSSFFGSSMMNSGGGASGNTFALRPVVSLESDVQIETSNGANQSNTPHIIKW